MPILFALVGPTAIGKTELSLRLAEALGAEVLCMDSRQVYRGFRIGTAQPTTADRARVKHHLTDFLEPEERFSAGSFLKRTKEILALNPGKNFLLVGGTGLYLKALTEGLPEIPEISSKVKAQLRELYEGEGLAKCCRLARSLDPEAMENIRDTDTQRILRVIEVFWASGRKLSEWHGERTGGLGPLPTFFLEQERAGLYEKIDRRTEAMFKAGWPEEAEVLSQKVPPSAPAWNSLGYREILKFLSGELSKTACLELVQRETRHFAKRQITWFKHQTPARQIDVSAFTAAEIFDRLLKKFG